MNLLIQVICLQLVIAAVILFVLWSRLQSELMAEALRFLEQGSPDAAVQEVMVIVASTLSPREESRLKHVVQKAFPAAALTLAVEPALRAGCVIKAGGLLCDMSLLTRMKHLWGQTDA